MPGVRRLLDLVANALGGVVLVLLVLDRGRDLLLVAVAEGAQVRTGRSQGRTGRAASHPRSRCGGRRRPPVPRPAVRPWTNKEPAGPVPCSSVNGRDEEGDVPRLDLLFQELVAVGGRPRRRGGGGDDAQAQAA